MRNFFIFFPIFIFATSISVLAQDQCTIALNDAEDKFDQGRLYEIPEMINSCLEEGFTDEEKIRAYRLLTLTWLFLNYYDKADSSYLKLLKLSPEYQPNEELDPMELINHAKKFTTAPIFYLTLGKVGVNFSSANVLLDYSISQSKNKTENYKAQAGFHAGVGAEMVIYQNLRLGAEFFYTQSRLRQTDRHWNFYSTSIDLLHRSFTIPVMLQYNFNLGKINPFISAGVSPEFLINSSAKNIKGGYTVIGETGKEEEFPVQPRPTINITSMRNKFNYSILAGGGINYKIGLNYLVFEIRYSKGMLNVTDTKSRWREDEGFLRGRSLKFPPGHVDDDFKIDELSFFVGFVKPLYKPRKIK